MASTTQFAGHKKVGESVLTGAEMWLKGKVVPRIPRRIETYHLTMTTLLWSAGVIGFSLLARDNILWLAGASAMIFAQYVTDLFDGAVGRYRNTGLVKWGYYMDHFLDYVFTAALIAGFAIIAPVGLDFWFLGLLAVAGGFMVNSFLSFAATNELEIYFYGMGPTEFRIFLIAVNTSLMITGTGHFAYTIPAVCGLSALGLAALMYRTHKKLWQIDMDAALEDFGEDTRDKPQRKLAA